MEKEIKLSLEYDVERPYGPAAETDEGRQLRKRFVAFDRFLTKTLDELAVPRTFFVIGQYLEGCLKDFSKEELREIYNPENPLQKIESHTFSHSFLVKPVDRNENPIISPVEFARDLQKANEVIEQILGIKPFGLSMPYGYEGGIGDVPEFLKVLSDMGFKYVISDVGTDVGKKRQPHTYKAAGFPDIVEIPIHGGEDVFFTEEKSLRFLEREPDSKEAILSHYKSLFETIRNLAEKNPLPLYVGLVFHSWAMAEYDPSLEIHKRIIEMARGVGARIITFDQVADEIMKQ